LQDIHPDLDRRGSKKSILPSSTNSGFFGLTALIGCIGSFSLADTLIEVTSAPIDSNDITRVRTIINILPKKRLLMAQPITPDETNTPNREFFKKPHDSRLGNPKSNSLSRTNGLFFYFTRKLSENRLICCGRFWLDFPILFVE
jgi:hypothetical protein